LALPLETRVQVAARHTLPDLGEKIERYEAAIQSRRRVDTSTWGRIGEGENRGQYNFQQLVQGSGQTSQNFGKKNPSRVSKAVPKANRLTHNPTAVQDGHVGGSGKAVRPSNAGNGVGA